MIQLLKLILIFENSRFVRWVTLHAYKIFWGCVFLNLFFNTMELVDRINKNKRDVEVELNSSGEMIETNWLKIIIDHYWISLVLFSLVYWGVRSRRRKKGLSWSQYQQKNTHSWHHRGSLIGWCLYRTKNRLRPRG